MVMLRVDPVTTHDAQALIDELDGLRIRVLSAFNDLLPREPVQ
jgi:hypothetical protein